MFTLKRIKNVLLVLVVLLCLYPIGSSIAGDCSDKGADVGTPTVIGNPNYSENWNSGLQFDPSNPDEIAPNSSIPINFIGGCSPYTWSVTGNGFSLGNSQTTGLSNTLIADGTACGTATIIVTGCSGPPVTGYVRCTEGQWSSNYDLYTSGCGRAPTHGCGVYEVRGHMRLRANIWCIYMGSSGCGTCNTNCEEVTGSPMDDVNISCNDPTYHECFTVTKFIDYWECVP